MEETKGYRQQGASKVQRSDCYAKGAPLYFLSWSASRFTICCCRLDMVATRRLDSIFERHLWVIADTRAPDSSLTSQRPQEICRFERTGRRYSPDAQQKLCGRNCAQCQQPKPHCYPREVCYPALEIRLFPLINFVM